MNATAFAPSVFESFNARALPPALIAKTFVPSSNYDKLATRAHSLVIGPRGSGKTTLLKMLHLAALEAWSSDVAQAYRDSIDYTGVFIATDVSWGRQLEALGGGKLRSEYQALFGNATFTCHVLRAIVSSFLYRTHSHDLVGLTPFRRVSLTQEQERAIVAALSSAWFVSPTLQTFSSLKYALTARLSEIHSLAHKESLLSDDSRAERLASIPYLHLHFLSAAAIAIELFNDAASAPDDRWALLIDEFELAPRWIREELLRAMRSTDDRFLFKLSMSPYSADVAEITGILSAMPGNDYVEVPLWFAHKEQGYQLCEALFRSMMKERGFTDKTPEDIFGVSAFDTNPDDWVQTGTAYRIGTRQFKRLQRMNRTDVTFRRYLEHKKIDLDKLDELSGNERAAELRKIAPLLAVREAFRAPDGGSASLPKERSRKNPSLYSGAKALFAMVEGNPRWFIGIIGKLISQYAATQTPISPTKQSWTVANAAQRFRALIGTIPYKSRPAARTPGGLLDILDAIGNYLFKSVVMDDFNADPPGSFVVNEECDDELLDMLGVALNTGAIVYVPNNSAELVLKSLKGKRFRLSYLLSPMYHIPIRLGRPVALETMVSVDNFHPPDQPQLFPNV